MKLLKIKNQLILIAILSLLLPSLSTAGSLSFGSLSFGSFSPFSYYPNFYIPDTKVQKSVDEEDKRLGEARKAIKQYMQERSEGTYKIGEIEDRNTHYLAEIFGPGDEVIAVLIVDKQTNKSQFFK